MALEPLHHRKSINFHACLQNKIRRTAPKASRKRHKSNPKSIKNAFCEKLAIAILYIREPGSRSPRRPNFDSTIDTKSDLETSPERNWNFSLGAQQTLKIRSPNQAKINGNRVHPAAPMVLQGAPEAPRRSPRVPKWRHQAPQMATERN